MVSEVNGSALTGVEVKGCVVGEGGTGEGVGEESASVGARPLKIRLTPVLTRFFAL